jgi:predicted RNA binding protein YcfA (HicA-like mRNA interferase family)
MSILAAHGWIEEPALSTDHRQFSRVDGSRKVTVQHPGRLGTRKNSTVFKSIVRQMGVNRSTFANWYYEGKE